MRLRVATLTTSTDQGVLRSGLMSATISLPSDGIYFQYDQTNANWQLVKRVASVTTTTVTSFPVTVNQWVKLRIAITGAGVVTAFLNDTSIAIPSGTLTTGAGMYNMTSTLIKSLGTVAMLVDVDYFQLALKWNVAR